MKPSVSLKQEASRGSMLNIRIREVYRVVLCAGSINKMQYYATTDKYILSVILAKMCIVHLTTSLYLIYYGKVAVVPKL